MRWGINILLYAFAALVITSCGVSRSAQLPMVSYNTPYRVHPHLTDRQADSIMALYGVNKEFCADFLEPTLIALSYFPELQKTKLHFGYSKLSTTMAARPKPLSMIFGRVYVVLINSDEEFRGVHLRDVPFNAQIGLIAHELSHIVDYQNRNLYGVSGVLFRYSDRARRPLYEMEIDRATIDRGLGWQLYDWAQFSLENPYSSEEYKKFKRENYMQPWQIDKLISFLAKYNYTLD